MSEYMKDGLGWNDDDGSGDISPENLPDAYDWAMNRIIYLEALLSRMAKAGDGLTINPKVGDYAEREKAWNKVWLEWKNGTEEEENE